jgi:CRP-like cAMP-binding protein
LQTFTNTLLGDIPECEYAMFLPHLESVLLQKNQTLFSISQRTPYVYFPANALISMCIDLPEGTSVEALILGGNSSVGATAVDAPSFYRATVFNAGLAYRMSADVFKKVSRNCPVYLEKTSISLNKLLSKLARKLACSKHHTIEQQVLHWLISTTNQGLDSVIKVTQQELADFLGFRREAVSIVIRRLQSHGHVKLSRGAIEVINITSLVKLTCSCYSYDEKLL